MTVTRGLNLPLDLFSEVTRFKIRIAGELGRVPTNPEVIRAMLAVSENHYTETLESIKAES